MSTPLSLVLSLPRVRHRARLRRRSFVELGPILLVVLLLGGVTACTPQSGSSGTSSADESRNFRYVRGGDHLLRIDSRTGQVFRAQLRGTSAWEKVGDPVSIETGEPHADRFQLNYLPGRGVMGGGSDMILRWDSDTGQTWMMKVAPGAIWYPIAEPDAEADEGDAAEVATGDSTAAAPPPPRSPGLRSAGASESETIAAVPPGKAQVSREQALEEVAEFKETLESDLPTPTRIWAVRNLARYDGELAGPPLMIGLTDTDPDVVVATIEALQALDYGPATAAIFKLRNHPSGEVRAKVAQAIKISR